MNENNLIQNKGLSSDQARENGRIGGIASGEARRRKKAMKERLLLLMEEPSQIDQATSNGDKMAAALMAKAADGDLKAIRLIGEYLGDFKQKIEFEDTTPKMTIEEAKALYEVGCRLKAEAICSGEAPLILPLFDESCKMLGKLPSDVVRDIMNCDVWDRTFEA